MAQNEQKYDIAGGPNPLGLAWCLLTCYAQNETVRQTHFQVRFDSKSASHVKVRISSLGHEDGSNERWVVTGTTANQCYHYSVNQRFEAFYDSTRRTGWIKFC